MLGIVQIGRELTGTGGQGDVDMGRFGFVLAAGYRAFAIARWGTTAGKALLELEVVSFATSRRPALAQALRRELILFSFPVVFSWADYIVETVPLVIPEELFDVFVAISFVTFMVLLLHASLRVPGKRAVWDRAAGTMVRYRTGRGSAGTLT